VDANEEKSECQLCERGGFTPPSSWKCPFVSASEEKSEAQQAFCNVKSSVLRVGRFVDTNEEKSECQLCERGGFAHPSSWERPFASASEGESEAQHAFCNAKPSALPERSLILLAVTDL